MILKQWIERFRGQSSAKQLAQEVALRCRQDVWDRVWRRVSGMELTEARGYVRARAAIVVDREVQTIATHFPVKSPARRQRLFDEALAGVTQLIMAEARALQAAPVRRAA